MTPAGSPEGSSSPGPRPALCSWCRRPWTMKPSGHLPGPHSVSDLPYFCGCCCPVPGSGSAGLGGSELGGPHGRCSLSSPPAPGPPCCGESVAWGVSLRTSASVGVSSAFALPLRDGPHLSRRVRLWAAPGLGSRHVGALGLIGGQASSHRSAGHGVMGCRAHGSPPACSQGHLCWEHGGGFVLLSGWPETPGPFQCGPRPLPSVLQAVSSPPPGPRADGAPQAVESLGRPPCGSRALSPDGRPQASAR